MMRWQPASHATQAERNELGKSTAQSTPSRRSRQATLHQRASINTIWSNHGAPSNAAATYGLTTPMNSAWRKRCRSARTAGVAMTASPIQLGRNTAIFMVSDGSGFSPQSHREKEGAAHEVSGRDFGAACLLR